MTKQRSRTHLEVDEPVGSGLRSRTTTISVDTPTKIIHRQGGIAHGSLISINRSKAALRTKPSFRSSIKRPPTSEYTSITDAIYVDDTEEEEIATCPEEPSSQSPTLELPQNEEEGDEFSDAPSQSASIQSLPEGSHVALSVTSEHFNRFVCILMPGWLTIRPSFQFN